MRGPKPVLVCAGVAVVIAIVSSLLLATNDKAHPLSKPGQLQGSPTSQQAALLYSAEQVLIGDCMRGHGFRYWPLPYTGPPVPHFHYAISNVRQAREHGFGSQPAAQGADPNARYLSGLPAGRKAAYGVVLNGPGPGGPGWLVTLPQGGELGQSKDSCQTAAESRLYGDFPAWFRAETITDDLPYLWIGRVMSSPRYQRELTRWARCMRSRGYPFTSPDVAQVAFGVSAGQHLRPAEIKAAVAAAHCTGMTRLNSVARQLVSSYGKAVRRQYRKEVSRYSQLSLSAVPRAIKVVRSAQHAGLPAQLATGKVMRKEGDHFREQSAKVHPGTCDGGCRHCPGHGNGRLGGSPDRPASCGGRRPASGRGTRRGNAGRSSQGMPLREFLLL
jgi:hypothetical protein